MALLTVPSGLIRRALGQEYMGRGNIGLNLSHTNLTKADYHKLFMERIYNSKQHLMNVLF